MHRFLFDFWALTGTGRRRFIGMALIASLCGLGALPGIAADRSADVGSGDDAGADEDAGVMDAGSEGGEPSIPPPPPDNRRNIKSWIPSSRKS